MENSSPVKKKLFYIFNGRFPSEKAHALYVAKHCEAFSLMGFDMTLIVPNRSSKARISYSTFYNIKESFRVFYVPTFDLYRFSHLTKLAFFVNRLFFLIFVGIFFLFKSRKKSIIFSHDSILTLILGLMGKKVMYEMHDYPDQQKKLFSLLFRKVYKIVTQNEWKKKRLITEFKLSPEEIIVEPNGVDVEAFSIASTKEEARRVLKLPNDVFIALYTGHLFDWKGADILAQAASFLDDSYRIIFVGGSLNDVLQFQKKHADTKQIMIMGYKPHSEIPLWQKASDCLVLPNTAKMDISKYYTSPMKLFEYMASERPILASDLPSIRAVVGDDAVTFVNPDDPLVLANAIKEVKGNYSAYTAKVNVAKEQVYAHSWEQRALRLTSLCSM